MECAIVALIVYALVVTGLLLVVLAGSKKDITDLIVRNSDLREALFEQARTAVRHNQEMKDTKEQKLELLRKYVQVQNAYAWLRICTRDIKKQEIKHESTK